MSLSRHKNHISVCYTNDQNMCFCSSFLINSFINSFPGMIHHYCCFSDEFAGRVADLCTFTTYGL